MICNPSILWISGVLINILSIYFYRFAFVFIGTNHFLLILTNLRFIWERTCLVCFITLVIKFSTIFGTYDFDFFTLFLRNIIHFVCSNFSNKPGCDLLFILIGLIFEKGKFFPDFFVLELKKYGFGSRIVYFQLFRSLD